MKALQTTLLGGALACLLAHGSIAEEQTTPILTALSTTQIRGYVDVSSQWNPGTGTTAAAEVARVISTLAAADREITPYESQLLYLALSTGAEDFFEEFIVIKTVTMTEITLTPENFEPAWIYLPARDLANAVFGSDIAAKEDFERAILIYNFTHKLLIANHPTTTLTYTVHTPLPTGKTIVQSGTFSSNRTRGKALAATKKSTLPALPGLPLVGVAPSTVIVQPAPGISAKYVFPKGSSRNVPLKPVPSLLTNFPLVIVTNNLPVIPSRPIRFPIGSILQPAILTNWIFPTNFVLSPLTNLITTNVFMPVYPDPQIGVGATTGSSASLTLERTFLGYSALFREAIRYRYPTEYDWRARWGRLREIWITNPPTAPVTAADE